MEKAGGMDEFNQRREEDRLLPSSGEQPGAQEDEGRPDALAGFLEEIAADLGDKGIGGLGQLFELLLDVLQLVLDLSVKLAEVGLPLDLDSNELAGLFVHPLPPYISIELYFFQIFL
jgi:hypothetical protein